MEEEGYVSQLWGKDAVAQINAHDRETPLFLYLAFTTRHSLTKRGKSSIDKYKNMDRRDTTHVRGYDDGDGRRDWIR